MQQHLLAEDFQPVTTDEATAAALAAQSERFTALIGLAVYFWPTCEQPHWSASASLGEECIWPKRIREILVISLDRRATLWLASEMSINRE